jgi:hypothetical protein
VKIERATISLMVRIRSEPCGCVVSERFGHTHTELCETHAREISEPSGRAEPNNLDLVGG